jgi:hypothetical protein
LVRSWQRPWRAREALELLDLHRNALDRVSAELLKVEALDASAFYALIDRNSAPLPKPDALQVPLPAAA